MENSIITQTIEFVRQELIGMEAGHDWEHVKRVWKIAKHIASTESADGFVVELGALLHDVADSKFHGGDEQIGPQKARDFLVSMGVEQKIIEQVEIIIRHISFKGGNFKQQNMTPELAVVQDADRLDAMGAIGIARTFNFGGFKNRPLYDPQIKPDLNMDPQTYKQRLSPTLNHFYEKLLFLKDRMNTVEGRRMAYERHEFMVRFLDEFLKEWNFNSPSVFPK